MNRAGHESADFFFGEEVEHTPAQGQRTLFVIGYHTVEEIEQALGRTADTFHIFFGANDSYWPQGTDELTAWENVISTFLDRGYLCSLDIPFSYVAQFHEHSGLCERDRFIPIIKVPIPYIRLWNYNTCIKIDDQDFADSNPGVWVHQLHDLMTRESFTDWQQYSKDKVVK
jgi:hypothetical protein